MTPTEFPVAGRQGKLSFTDTEQADRKRARIVAHSGIERDG